MPTVRGTTPDGKTFRVTVPEGMTHEQIAAEIDAAFSQPQPQAAAQPAQDATDEQRLQNQIFDRAPEQMRGLEQKGREKRVEHLGASAAGHLGQGASFGFSDEIQGVASGVGSALSGGSFGEGYREGTDAARDRLEAYQAAYPGRALAAETAGAIGTTAVPVFGQLGRVAQGASTGARALAAGRAGVVTGGLYGAGTAEGGVIERAKGAGAGGAIGGAAGLVATPVIEGAAALGRAAMRPATRMLRGAASVNRQAAKDLTDTMRSDIATGTRGLTDDQIALAQRESVPITVADIGGEQTRRLARNSANQSPEAAAMLRGTFRERYEGQAERVGRYLKRFIYADRDIEAARIANRAEAAKANAPRYRAAYGSQNAQAMWDDEFAQLMQAPAVKQAVKDVVPRSANKSAAEGFRPVLNPFEMDESFFNAQGTVRLKETAGPPNLQFWDQVKRNLDDDIGKARLAGERSLASDLMALKRQLVSKLDDAVPEYAQARAGAAAFFDAEDALDAGEKFATSTRRIDPREFARQFGAFSDAEKTLFRDGFITKLTTTMNGLADNRDVRTAIFANNPNTRAQLRMVLGKEGAAEFEQFLQLENVMKMTKEAVEGNSRTAEFLIDAGLFAGGAGASHYMGGDPTVSVLVGAMLGGGRFAGRKAAGAIDERVARRTAELLLSDDPEKIRQLAQAAAKNPTFRRALDEAERVLSTLYGQQGGQFGASIAQGVAAEERTEPNP
jgi:hypothetical protein